MRKTELGTALRELRKASGKEAKTVARSAVMSASKLSKIETGKLAPSVVDVESILTAIGVSDEVKCEYMEAARAASTEVMAWRLLARMGYHKGQQQAQALEAQMSLLRLFQPALIPGLLQTPEYIRAVIARHGLTEESQSRTLAARLDRQKVLYDRTKQLRFIITESVLRWRITSSAIMAGQIDRLISLSRLPNIDIRIVALSAPQHDFPSHSFVIRDERIVTVETVHAEVVVTDPRDIKEYTDKFEGFSSTSLSGDEMRTMLEMIRDKFLQERETS
ncbi:helix-turn-helix domain-containing protein [Streptomyces sp. NBC_01476]|uniref:helix-turn-helix domain-containing protein n=1 Tax=Streptomyces sp. NBC_01476 TaxID=2903881 RepID=UPI002E2F8CE6|nr:helix-turn-helix transcriptional regulator [Streptomyces sp. NBC_01476]